MHSIKGSTMRYISQLILAPIALLLKKINDMNSRKSVFQHKPANKEVSNDKRFGTNLK
jgi:hypothetical protein